MLSTIRQAFHLFASGLGALLIVVITINGASAQEQRRVALVIGNDDYENVPKLAKAGNDAQSVSDRLADIGFQVTTAKDIGRRAMSRAVLEFEKTIEPGDLALFYYAGHGFAVSGQNFLLPVDIPQAGPGEEGLVRDEAFLADDLADRLQKAGAATVVLVLDACRNNPFEVAGKRSIDGNAGLARMAPSQGVFVLFSAGIGQAALDRLNDQDDNPNSVFTRKLLSELEKPNASIVDIAKSTQVAVRDLAASIGHVQTPAYYDQIIGTVTLNPDASAGLTRGTTDSFQEGTTVAMLPRLDPKPREGKGKPIASFMRSNAGWTVNISLPEPAIQFGYRIGKDGDFVDTGTMAQIDQRTGAPMPVTWFSLPSDQKPGDLFVTWRDKRGEEAGVFPIRFDPDNELKAGQKQILDQLWTAWISFREYNGLLVYFSHLISYRCGIEKVEYKIDNSGDWQTWEMAACDPANPHVVPDQPEIYRKLPKATRSMQLVVTYFDGTKSPERNFNVQF
ncbi:MAG: caspase family protein [Rhizobiaceae bacterium]